MLVAVGVVMTGAVLQLGWVRAWTPFVPVGDPPFQDTSGILQSAESAARGFDPMVTNPGGLVLNYPRIWQHAAVTFGWTNADRVAFGVVGVVMPFVLAGVALLQMYPRWVYFLFFCSGAVALGIERGNVDLLMFALVVFSLVVSGLSGDLLRLAATALKVFPFLAQVALAAWTPSVRGLVACGVGAAYLVVIRHQLALIRHSTLRGCRYAYGVWACVDRWHLGLVPLGFSPPFVDAALLALGAVAVAGGLWLGATRCSAERADARAGALYVAGASVYVGTFLLDANWDYRLVFVLLCVPYWLGDRRPRVTALVVAAAALNEHLLVAALGQLGGRIGLVAKWLLLVVVAKGAGELAGGRWRDDAA